MRNALPGRRSVADITCRFPWVYIPLRSTFTQQFGSHDIGTLANVGSPDFATRAGWFTGDGSTMAAGTVGNMDDTTYGAARKAVLELGSGCVLVWAQVNVNALSTGEDAVLTVGGGVGGAWRVAFRKNTTWRLDCTIADRSGAAGVNYAGASNLFNSGVDVSLAWLIDNRISSKTYFGYVNGAQAQNASMASTDDVPYAGAATRVIRIGADGAGTPATFAQGAIRRLGVVNFGTSGPPSNIGTIIERLSQRQGIPPFELSEA